MKDKTGMVSCPGVAFLRVVASTYTRLTRQTHAVLVKWAHRWSYSEKMRLALCPLSGVVSVTVMVITAVTHLT